MENLYHTLRDKKIHINSMGGDLLKGDYYLFFLEECVPRMIDYVIDHMKLDGIQNINHIEDIPAGFHIHFLKENDRQEPHMNMHPEFENMPDVFLHISEKHYDELVSRIVSFCDTLNPNLELEEYSGEVRGIKINTNLALLIVTYGYEIASDSRFKDSAEGVYAYLNKSLNQYNALTTTYTDTVHAKYFEHIFLDRYLVDIIKLGISYLTQRNLQDKEKENIPITYYLELTSERRNTSGYLYIPNRYFAPLAQLIEDFLNRYQIGSIFNYDGKSTVKINTHLNDLIDAYYMEKQRIEYHIQGTESSKKNIL